MLGFDCLRNLVLFGHATGVSDGVLPVLLRVGRPVENKARELAVVQDDPTRSNIPRFITMATALHRDIIAIIYERACVHDNPALACTFRPQCLSTHLLLACETVQL